MLISIARAEVGTPWSHGDAGQRRFKIDSFI